jgi:hypothetical protein
MTTLQETANLVELAYVDSLFSWCQFKLSKRHILREVFTNENPSVVHGYIRTIKLTDTLLGQSVEVVADQSLNFSLKEAEKVAMNRLENGDFDWQQSYATKENSSASLGDSNVH